MVVLRGISVVMTPPSVSTPRESGVTSSSTSPARLVAGEDGALDRRADRDDFVRVDALMRLLARTISFGDSLRPGHAGGAADQHHFVDVAGLDAGVFQGGERTALRMRSKARRSRLSNFARVIVCSSASGRSRRP